MVLRQPRTTYNTGLPIRRPSPARTLQNDRGLECQTGTPPVIRSPASHPLHEFAPTPNRFSILAGLSASPDTTWAFDFTPTSSTGKSCAKRRGKRGGKQQRLKHALKRACEDSKADGVDELCGRFATLRLDDDARTAALCNTDNSSNLAIQRPESPLDVSAVRHHWAPKFRPSLLPTSKSTFAKSSTLQPTTLSQEPQRSLTSPNLGQGLSSEELSIEDSPRSPKILPQFPLSAFLKDLTSPSECAGYCPPDPPKPEPATSSPTKHLKSAAIPIATSNLAATETVRCASVLCSDTASQSNDAVKSREAVPAISSFSTSTLTTDKHKRAFETPQFTPSSKPVPATPPTLASTPASALLPTALDSKELVSASASKSPVGFLGPAVSSIDSPSLPMLRIPSEARPSLPQAPARPFFGWRNTSEGITVFRPSAAALVTAPITSPYPFVYAQRPWALTSLSSNISEDRSSMTDALKRGLSYDRPSPDAQFKMAEFLEQGHARDCWCSSFRHQQSSSKTAPTSAAIEGARPQMERKGHLSLHTSSLDTVTGAVPPPPDSQDYGSHSESESSDGVVLATPSSEDASSDFEEIEASQDQSIDSDEEWLAVSPRLPAYQPSAPITFRTASVALIRASAVSPFSEVSAALPSPPQTPSLSAYQARVSADESETEWSDFRSWDEPSLQSVRDVKEELWNTREPDMQYTSTSGWPTLQEAMEFGSTGKDQDKEEDDGWGGKVWDGVTDSF